MSDHEFATLKKAVREVLREELGVRGDAYAIESKVLEQEESIRASLWERRWPLPKWLELHADKLGLDQLVPHVIRCANLKLERVYFIQAGDSGPVKIGVTKAPTQRLAELQVANHEPLALRALVPGDQTIESFYHSLFRAQRIRGEWFAPCPRMELVMRAAAELQDAAA